MVVKGVHTETGIVRREDSKIVFCRVRTESSPGYLLGPFLTTKQNTIRDFYVVNRDFLCRFTAKISLITT